MTGSISGDSQGFLPAWYQSAIPALMSESTTRESSLRRFLSGRSALFGIVGREDLLQIGEVTQDALAERREGDFDLGEELGNEAVNFTCHQRIGLTAEGYLSARRDC